MREHHLITVKAAERAAANALFKGNLDTPGGERTFTVPLFKVADLDDSAPDRYWCATRMTPAIKALWLTLRVQLLTMTHNAYDPETEPNFPEQFLAQRGLRRALFTP